MVLLADVGDLDERVGVVVTLVGAPGRVFIPIERGDTLSAYRSLHPAREHKVFKHFLLAQCRFRLVATQGL